MLLAVRGGNKLEKLTTGTVFWTYDSVRDIRVLQWRVLFVAFTWVVTHFVGDRYMMIPVVKFLKSIVLAKYECII
jgi:hypothetical protein